MRAIIVVTLGICAGAERGWAQDSGTRDEVAAEQLFVEGRALMAEEKYEAACPKLQASLELDPASGTQINLARCYEKLGKLATAWRHYREASDRAIRDGNTARARVARKLAAELEPRLPRLIIAVAAPAGMRELVVRRDGMIVTAALFGAAVYVDPGTHAVTATAAGRLPFSTTVTVAEAATSTVEIPTLAPAPEATAPRTPGAPDASDASEPATPGARPRPGRALTPGQDVIAGRVDADTGPGSRGGGSAGRQRRLAGLVTGGVGLAGVGVGVGVGAAAYRAWNDAFDSGACDRMTLQCTGTGQARVETARSRARLSNIASGIGVAAVVTGAVLYFTAPRAPDASDDRRMTRVLPWTGAGNAGVAITGSF
jgi:serine/threonine-protein kinase